MAALVSFDRVTKRFGDFTAVDGLSLDIHEREFFALLGPSGCGKTTTLRMIGGFEEPTSGRIYLDGRDVVNLPPYRRDVNTVFQSYALFPHLSIFENVAFGLHMQGGMSRSDIEGRVERSLRRAALWDEVRDRLDKSALQLSGGQQQRLCIARCLAVEPEVILMDEPASALDPSATARIEELVLELKRDYTIVVVTHNMQQAARISDRTAFMLTGKLVEYDETAFMFTSPKEKLTEEYITGRFG